MVGLIGGTFNPIHFGHIHLALAMQEAHQLEAVWFIPSLQNPFKKELSAPFADRYKMVELGIDGVPYCQALPIEGKRSPPSYTIDTVRELKQKYPNKNFHLLLGDDHLPSLSKWKEVEELLQLSPPYIATRGALIVPPTLKSLIRNGITKIPLLDISSTCIRERLKKGLYCRHLVPARVLDYIQQNGLYY